MDVILSINDADRRMTPCWRHHRLQLRASQRCACRCLAKENPHPCGRQHGLQGQDKCRFRRGYASRSSQEESKGKCVVGGTERRENQPVVDVQGADGCEGCKDHGRHECADDGWRKDGNTGADAGDDDEHCKRGRHQQRQQVSKAGFPAKRRADDDEPRLQGTGHRQPWSCEPSAA